MVHLRPQNPQNFQKKNPLIFISVPVQGVLVHMVRRRGAVRKKPRRRRLQSRAEDQDGDGDEDLDYIVGEEEEDDDESEGSYESDVSPRGSSDEESFQFSSSDEEDDEEEEIEPAAPKRRRTAAPRKRRRKTRASDDDEEEEAVSAPAPRAGSRRRRSRAALDLEDVDEDDDEDFAPDEDVVDEEELSPVVSRKSSSGRKGTRGRPTKKRESKGLKPKGRNKRKPAAAAPARKRRRSADDDDFIVEDEEDGKPRKKSKTGRRRKKAVSRGTSERSLADTESSDSDFVVSDDDFVLKDRDLVTIDRHLRKDEPARKKRTTSPNTRKKRRSVESDSSDFDYMVPEEELQNLGIERIADHPKPKKIVVKKKGEEKGKEKEADASEKQVCGICLSEEQKGTVQGVLNCCAHYFCFACIMEWSKVESRCPVCKRRFITISKSARSDPGLGQRRAVIRVQRRDQVYQPSEEEIRVLLDPYEHVVCMVCQQGGDDYLMLLCDICDSSAHTFCVGLGREVPEGNWYCEGCRSTEDASSNSQVQDTTIDQGTSSSDLFSGGLEPQNLRTVHGGTNFRQSTSFPSLSSSQGFDLNLSPRHLSGEDHGVAFQASRAGASTSSGRHGIHQRVRIRLSDSRIRQRGDLFSGSTNSQIQGTTVDQGTRNGNLFSDGLVTEDLRTNIPASTNTRESVSFPNQSSSQRIDLNVSPRHLSGENLGVATQASGAGASTLSGRRAIHQRIRILLSNSRPRQIFSRTDESRHNVENDVITSEAERGRRPLHVLEGQNPLYTGSATEPVLQSNAAYMAPCTFSEGSYFRHVEGAKEQVQTMVKSHLKNLSRGISLERETFKEIARRSTHTILAACGIEHRRSMAAAPVQPPNSCSHDSDDGPANLLEGCCSSCFISFVRDVIQNLIDTA